MDRKHKKLLIVALILAVALAVSLFYNFYDGEGEPVADLEEKLEYREREYEQRIDSLERTLEELRVVKEVPPLLDERQIKNLQEKGLDDPVKDLREDLMEDPDLITQEGVLGGTMGFYFSEGIHILNERWVLAYFEDGHVGGAMLLRYDVLPGGDIKWEVIDDWTY